MKEKLRLFSRRYAAALKQHLAGDDLRPAKFTSHLGQRAVALGIETLDLAKIHEKTLRMLAISGRMRRQTARAAVFFDEALTPLVTSHGAIGNNRTYMHHLSAKLQQRTRELAKAGQFLHVGIMDRKKVEAALKKSGEHYIGLLKDSMLLEQNLRKAAREVITSHENKRHKLSRELQNGIAQALLGMNIRLFNLKRENRDHEQAFKNKIANSRKMVLSTNRSINQALRKFRTA